MSWNKAAIVPGWKILKIFRPAAGSIRVLTQDKFLFLVAKDR